MTQLARKQLLVTGVLCLSLLGAGSGRSAAAAPAASTATAAPAVTAPLDPAIEAKLLDRNYRLGPGDVIEILVTDHPEYSETVKLYLDGTIDHPVAGKVQAAGLTTEALAQQITGAMKKELKRPIVAVSLRSIYVPPKPPAPEKPVTKITVLGVVSQKGVVDIGEPKPLRQVLAQVNPLPTADLAHIRVRYPDGKGRECDFSQFASTGVAKDDILIHGGEELIFVEVPPAVKPDPIRIQVLGAVSKPGPFVIEREINIVEAIDRAGGPKLGADLEAVKIENPKRQNPLTINVEKYMSGDLAADYVLKPGDSVVVPEKPWRILIVGEVSRPGYMPIKEGATILDVFLAAGASGSGDETKAELLRRGKSGKAERKTVNIRDIYKNPDKKNLVMAKDDVLFIPHKTIKRGILYYLGTVASPLWLMRSFGTGF